MTPMGTEAPPVPEKSPGERSYRRSASAPMAGNGRVVSGIDDADGLYGQYEIGGGDGFERAVGHVGGIDSDFGIEAAHDRAQVLKRSPPLAVGIVRHQGNEHGRLFMRESGPHFVFPNAAASFLSWGTAPSPSISGKAAICCRRVSSPGSRARIRLPAEPRMRAPEPWSDRAKSFGSASSAESYPAKGPVTSGRGSMGGPASRSRLSTQSQSRSVPRRSSPTAPSPSIRARSISPW